ncbi:MAG TPA: 50S ribosome-binding GTPase [Candidatus Dojkabacteria bacterium]|nr:50S ribosome-binding GTPase [Candidatus Dojkabacteria bacterium]HQF36551.1 50S ribosome-binding GTPase [Candidatus Dojkabacteria bacterium]
MKFTDTTTITCKGGKGGKGVISFDMFKKSSGGDGGFGGDVYIVGENNLYDLSHLVNGSVIKGNNGSNALIKNRKETARSGEDIFFYVPIKTVIYNEEGEEVGVISEVGQKQLIVKGGACGRGNRYFHKKIGKEGRYKATEGKPGEVKIIKLVLELYSDVIFIGYPNAGKSSLLNEITNAKVKVADYEFTTLKPQLGRLDGIVLMDLPGLIVGTHIGKGLGMSFLKHTKSSKLLLHIVSLENNDCFKSYQEMWKELIKIDKSLKNKKELIVLTKHDLVTKDVISENLKRFQKEKKECVVVSIHDYDALESLKLKIKKLLV